MSVAEEKKSVVIKNKRFEGEEELGKRRKSMVEVLKNGWKEVL